MPNGVRAAHAALRSDMLHTTHVDDDSQVPAFKGWNPHGSIVLTVANLGERSFSGHQCGVRIGGQGGRWRQGLCSQDADYGGWHGAGNAYYEPVTQLGGMLYLNLPKWSVVMLAWQG